MTLALRVPPVSADVQRTLLVFAVFAVLLAALFPAVMGLREQVRPVQSSPARVVRTVKLSAEVIIAGFVLAAGAVSAEFVLDRVDWGRNWRVAW